MRLEGPLCRNGLLISALLSGGFFVWRRFGVDGLRSAPECKLGYLSLFSVTRVLHRLALSLRLSQRFTAVILLSSPLVSSPLLLSPLLSPPLLSSPLLSSPLLSSPLHSAPLVSSRLLSSPLLSSRLLSSRLLSSPLLPSPLLSLL